MSIDLITNERREVINNIASAIANHNTFAKVETGDPVPTKEDISRVILKFDNMRKGPLASIRAFIARCIAEAFTEKVNSATVITGAENALSVDGGAVITSMHYNPTDSTPPRMLTHLMGKRADLHIVVQENNIFMKGLFGFLMRNCNTHPVSSNLRYMAKNLSPAINRLLSDTKLLLVYPEAEMWYNYKKPRPGRDGAYHWAKINSVPILPLFTEMRTLSGKRDSNGFLPIKHILHVLPPIYPDPALDTATDRERMRLLDEKMKREAYERIYKIPLTDDFIPERDIAGIVADTQSI